MSEPWCQIDIDYLVEFFPQGHGYRKLADKLDRTVWEIRHMVKKLTAEGKIPKIVTVAPVPWEKVDVDYLIEFYSKGISVKALAYKLDRTEDAIRAMARNLIRQGAMKAPDRSSARKERKIQIAKDWEKGVLSLNELSAKHEVSISVVKATVLWAKGEKIVAHRLANPSSRRKITDWTEAEDAILIESVKSGKTHKEIQKAVLRSVPSIESRLTTLKKHGLIPKNTKSHFCRLRKLEIVNKWNALDECASYTSLPEYDPRKVKEALTWARREGIEVKRIRRMEDMPITEGLNSRQRNYAAWTDEEIRLLRGYRKEGKTLNQIAALTGRSYAAICAIVRQKNIPLGW